MYYENLCKEKRQLVNENICFIINKLDIRKLTKEENESIERSVMEHEAVNFLKI